MKITIAEIKARFPDHTITLPDDYVINGISHDTRKIKPGQLYVAIRGTQYDGHDFITEARNKGAVLALVEDSAKHKLTGPNLIYCPDTVLGLGDLARDYRKKFSQPLIAITGSNGKTTTKEFLAHVLGQFGTVIATKGNLNNHIGVPLTIFEFRDDARFFIVEMGMNHLEEIRYLARMAKPDLGLITGVGQAHLEGVGGTLEKVAQAKSELFAELSETALALVNVDDPFINKMATPARTLTYGFSKNATIGGSDLKTELGRTSFTLTHAGESKRVQLTMAGLHHATNALAVFALGSSLGLDPKILHAGLESFTLTFNRGRHLEKNGCILIDDTYNANPGSMTVVLEAFQAEFPEKTKIAVLGGMRELGVAGEKLHRDVGQHARACGIDEIFAFGELAEGYLVGFGYNRDDQAKQHFTDHDTLAQAVHQYLTKHTNATAILVKGSRGMTMEKFIESF